MKIKKNFSHQLMENNITLSDRKVTSNYILNNDIFTQSNQVRKFEKEWSKWLGVKYSVFVNSGSSANYLTMLAVKILKGKGEIIVPPLTWNSDIVSVINNGFKPVFVDIDLKNLSMNTEQILKKITRKTKAVFLTHAQGFNGLSKELLSFLKKKKYLVN